jgi:hypothetical protein
MEKIPNQLESQKRNASRSLPVIVHFNRVQWYGILPMKKHQVPLNFPLPFSSIFIQKFLGAKGPVDRKFFYHY